MNPLLRKIVPRICPICKISMGENSCPIAANITQNIDHECEHDGCGKSMPLSELATHQESCPFRAKISDLDQPMPTESLEEEDLRVLLKNDVLPEVAVLGNPLTQSVEH